MADWKTHLKRAIELAGSQARLAQKMGCSQAKISWLLLTAEQLKAEDAVSLEVATDGIVPRTLTRPDIFPAVTAPEQSEAGRV